MQGQTPQGRRGSGLVPCSQKQDPEIVTLSSQLSAPHHEKRVVSKLAAKKSGSVPLGCSFIKSWFWQGAYVSDCSLSLDLSFPLPCASVSLWGCAVNQITEMIWAKNTSLNSLQGYF